MLKQLAGLDHGVVRVRARIVTCIVALIVAVAILHVAALAVIVQDKRALGIQDRFDSVRGHLL